MVTRHFKNLLAMALESSSVNYGSLPVRDVNGKIYYLASGSSFPGTRNETATTSATTAGISVGKGTTAANENDYQLEDHIASGIALAVTNKSSGYSDGKAYLEYQVTVTNTGSEAITISEICYKQSMKGVSRPTATSSSDIVVMVDRTVLDTPVTIQGGDAGIIMYRLATKPYADKTVGGVEIVSWTWGTDEQIAAMIDAANSRTINLQRDAGWQVGEIRTIPIAAFTGGNNVAHAAESIDIAISSFDDYNECGCVLQFDFVQSTTAQQRMNSSNTTTGGYGATEMYNDTLPALVEALPTWLKNRLKTFNVLCSKGGNELSTIETVGDNKLALRSAVEVFGSGGNGQPGEGSQIEYYKTAANRAKAKGINGSTVYWWERSPYSSANFCYVGNTGNAGNNYASYTIGVAPFGCI